MGCTVIVGFTWDFITNEASSQHLLVSSKFHQVHILESEPEMEEKDWGQGRLGGCFKKWEKTHIAS